MATTPAQCCWGSTPCRVPLEDISAAGINRHLKEHHFPGHGDWHPRDRGICQWQTRAGRCTTEAFYGNFGKHIATVHLGAMQRICTDCGEIFSRNDALTRHLEGYCPGLQPSGCQSGNHWQVNLITSANISYASPPLGQ
ncbi:predicted protein [Postia placenta Mad-698-R]|nr:predicted protein [Postia placenta Mad-698-R]